MEVIKLKKHALGFLALLGCWLIGGLIIDLLFAFLGFDISRFAPLLGIILGVVAWVMIVKSKSAKDPS